MLLSLWFIAIADDFASLRADRAAIERVYYNHRLGDKPPFEQALPRETLERLVRDDLRKEAALKKVYGVEITSAILEAEVRRITTTTRAPDRSNADYAIIGGGLGNIIRPDAPYATVAGGNVNTNAANDGAIGGGENTIHPYQGS